MGEKVVEGMRALDGRGERDGVIMAPRVFERRGAVGTHEIEVHAFREIRVECLGSDEIERCVSEDCIGGQGRCRRIFCGVVAHGDVAGLFSRDEDVQLELLKWKKDTTVVCFIKCGELPVLPSTCGSPRYATE